MSAVIPPESIEAEALETPKPINQDVPWPDPKKAWYVLGIIIFTLFVNFLDRGIVGILAPLIQADLALSDSQMGIIMGFAFVLFYMFAALPISRYADHGNRRNLIAIGMTLFGGATALCGLAKNFWSLFLFRMGVGVGDACTGPASYSMLADYFPPQKLTRAISFLNYGFIFGTGLAMLAGGAIVTWLMAMPSISLPFYGELAVWQTGMIMVGIPGIIAALLMLTVREPVRRVQGASPPVSQVVKYLGENKWLYGPMVIGIALNTAVAMGVASWVVIFYQRTFGWGIGQITTVLGTIMLVTMPIGAILGAKLAEYWTAKGYKDANMRVVLLVLVVSLPFGVIYPLLPAGWMAAGLYAVSAFIIAFLFGPQNAAIQLVTPMRMRGQITAVVLFGFNVIGMGIGPGMIGFLSDTLFAGAGDRSIAYSFSLVNAVISPLALAILFITLKPYRRMMEALEESGGIH